MNLIPVSTSITNNLAIYEQYLENLHRSYDDALFHANMLFDNAIIMNETNERVIKLNLARIAQEQANSLDLYIEEYEDNLYDLRKIEFTSVETHIYSIIQSKNNIYDEINKYKNNSETLLMKAADDGFQKNDLIAALYQQSINNDYIESLNMKLESINYTAKIYTEYLNHLSSLMSSYEERYM